MHVVVEKNTQIKIYTQFLKYAFVILMDAHPVGQLVPVTLASYSNYPIVHWILKTFHNISVRDTN